MSQVTSETTLGPEVYLLACAASHESSWYLLTCCAASQELCTYLLGSFLCVAILLFGFERNPGSTSSSALSSSSSASSSPSSSAKRKCSETTTAQSRKPRFSLVRLPVDVQNESGVTCARGLLVAPEQVEVNDGVLSMIEQEVGGGGRAQRKVDPTEVLVEIRIIELTDVDTGLCEEDSNFKGKTTLSKWHAAATSAKSLATVPTLKWKLSWIKLTYEMQNMKKAAKLKDIGAELPQKKKGKSKAKEDPDAVSQRKMAAATLRLMGKVGL